MKVVKEEMICNEAQESKNNMIIRMTLIYGTSLRQDNFEERHPFNQTL